MTPVYDVQVFREDDLWVVLVDGQFPPHSVRATDTPHFSDVHDAARDLIALLADLPEDGFDVRWHYEVDGADVSQEVAAFHDAEHEYRASAARHRESQRLRDDARAVVLRRLAAAGLTQRAMSDLVGVSQQRVHQLLRSPTPHPGAAAG